LAWKDHGDEECDGPLSAALADLVRMVLLTDRPGSKRVVLVPAPSSRASMRKRGRWQMLPVTRKMKSVLCDFGFQAEVRPALRLVGVRGKSVQTSGSSARSDRITGHVRLVDGAVSGIGADATVVVVDDIVTTGATMGQCAHVLETACDAYVVGAALVMTPVDSSSA
jgi:predicted amidophosphoribosyltransferase